MDFAAIDKQSGLRRKDKLKSRAKILGFPYVSQFIHEWYCVQGKRPKDIAWALRVSYQSIYRWLANWGFAPFNEAFITSYVRAASFTGALAWAPIHLQAVRKLWAAVMVQALKDIRADGKEAPEAMAWVLDTKRTDCPSFIWVAELLGLDPEAARMEALK